MKNAIKTLTSLTLAFTLILSGAVVSANANPNDGIMLLHDGPTHDRITH